MLQMGDFQVNIRRMHLQWVELARYYYLVELLDVEYTF